MKPNRLYIEWEGSILKDAGYYDRTPVNHFKRIKHKLSKVWNKLTKTKAQTTIESLRCKSKVGAYRILEKRKLTSIHKATWFDAKGGSHVVFSHNTFKF